MVNCLVIPGVAHDLEPMPSKVFWKCQKCKLEISRLDIEKCRNQTELASLLGNCSVTDWQGGWHKGR